MCGIAGIARLGTEPITREQIVQLLLGIEHRGGDATGIAMMTGNTLSWYKHDEIAWRFVKSQGFAEYLKKHLTPETQTVLLHTRAWTKGSPHKNMNNHPMTVGVSAAIHNGGIWNDDELFKDLKLKREAETDSDIIRAIADKEGLTKKTIRQYNRMRGSCASAIIHKDQPRELILMRSGSPCVLGLTNDHFMWCSVKDPLYDAAKIWRKRWGVWAQVARPDLRFSYMADDTAWLLNLDEMAANMDNEDYEPWHDEFKACPVYTKPTYDVHGRYREKTEKKEAEAEKEAATSCAAATCKPEFKDQAAIVNAAEAINKANQPQIVARINPLGKTDKLKADGRFLICPKNHCVVAIPKEYDGIDGTQIACGKCNVALKIPSYNLVN